MQPRTNIQINRCTYNRRINGAIAKQDDTVRQSEQKPQVGDLSKHLDSQQICRETDR
ncbi:hypothetical protein ACVNP0_03625 [Staphylococcus aureus]